MLANDPFITLPSGHFVKAAAALGAQLIKVDDGFNPYLANAPVAVAITADEPDELAPLPDPDEV